MLARAKVARQSPSMEQRAFRYALRWAVEGPTTTPVPEAKLLQMAVDSIGQQTTTAQIERAWSWLRRTLESRRLAQAATSHQGGTDA